MNGDYVYGQMMGATRLTRNRLFLLSGQPILCAPRFAENCQERNLSLSQIANLMFTSIKVRILWFGAQQVGWSARWSQFSAQRAASGSRMEVEALTGT
jgi:hypothetical protein